MQTSKPNPSNDTAKLSPLAKEKIVKYIMENYFRASKALPSQDYLDSAAQTWFSVIAFIPIAMWDKCYNDAVSNLPEGEFVTAHRIKAAWPRVKAVNTVQMFNSGVHYELRTCPRCGRQFAGVIQASTDVIVERRCVVSDQQCIPCPRYLLELHGVWNARLTVDQAHEVQVFLPEQSTEASLAWVSENI